MPIDQSLRDQIAWDEAPAAIDPNAVQWDDDHGLEIDIVGGTPVPAAEFAASAEGGGQQASPSLFRADSDFRERSGVGVLPMLGAAARDMFGSRESAAKYLAEKINEDKGLSSLMTGGAQVAKDENGEPLLRLPDGSTYRLNDPGIDSADAANVAGNIAAFWTPAQWAARIGQARNLGLAGRAATQAVAAGATDAALQAGFSDEYSPGRTAAAAVGGAGGEWVGSGIGALARRAAAAGRNASGANRAAAAGLLDQAGLPDPPESLVARLAPRMEEARAGANPNALVGAERYGFAYTQGQRMADPRRQFDMLSREEVLRQSPGGGQVLREAQAQNVQQLDTAISDLASRYGGRPGATPAELAQGAAQRVGQQADDLGRRINEAYETAGQSSRAAISSEAVQSLPQRLTAAVADFSPNEQLTPATARTLAQIREAATGVAENPNVRGVTLRALEAQRRIINNNIGAATNRADRSAMVALKREYDGWMDEAVESSLVSGDPAALQAIREARGLRAEYGRRFEGRGDADRFIAGLLDGTRTPEELVNIALGASQVSKAGGARFIDRLRQAAADDPGVVGNLRAAHFLRLTRGKNGEPLNMGQIVRNIRQTEYSNASVQRALYSPAEWGEIRALASAIEPLVPRGDFARSSGTGERLTRLFFQRMGLGGWPILGTAAEAIQKGGNTIRAERALNQPLRLPGQATLGSQPMASAAAVELER